LRPKPGAVDPLPWRDNLRLGPLKLGPGRRLPLQFTTPQGACPFRSIDSRNIAPHVSPSLTAINPYHYQRRHSREVKVGKVRYWRQKSRPRSSRCSPATRWIRANICVKQNARVGQKSACEKIVRITRAPRSRDRRPNLKNIQAELTAAGCEGGLLSLTSIFKPDGRHGKPRNGFEKVSRLIPGNLCRQEKVRHFANIPMDQYEGRTRSPSEETFQAACRSVQTKWRRHCASAPTHGFACSDPHYETALGDTPARGMVESAIEFPPGLHASTAYHHDFYFLDEVEQPQGNDQCLPVYWPPRLLELGAGLELTRCTSGVNRGR